MVCRRSSCGRSLLHVLLFGTSFFATAALAQQAVYLPDQGNSVVVDNPNDCDLEGSTDPCILISTLAVNPNDNFDITLINRGNFLTGGNGISTAAIGGTSSISIENLSAIVSGDVAISAAIQTFEAIGQSGDAGGMAVAGNGGAGGQGRFFPEPGSGGAGGAGAGADDGAPGANGNFDEQRFAGDGGGGGNAAGGAGSDGASAQSATSGGITIEGNAELTTTGTDAVGIFTKLSIGYALGGSGGDGGAAAGGTGGAGGTVSLIPDGAVGLPGLRGGDGGPGGVAEGGAAGDGGAGQAGDAGNVTIHNTQTIVTEGYGAAGARLVLFGGLGFGGAGGNGGVANGGAGGPGAAGSIGGVKVEGGAEFGNAGTGGSGGTGGPGGGAMGGAGGQGAQGTGGSTGRSEFVNTRSITTTGELADGLFVNSAGGRGFGGGGGSGGQATAGNGGSGGAAGPAGPSVAIVGATGGQGGTGGQAGSATGGAGGNGGNGIGGDSGDVELTNDSTITTAGAHAPGIRVLSRGGDGAGGLGGDGGDALGGAGGNGGAGGAASMAPVGGTGGIGGQAGDAGDAGGGTGGAGGDGLGGNAGKVTVTNRGAIKTTGADAAGIHVETRGGDGLATSGGNGGNATGGVGAAGGAGGAGGDGAGSGTGGTGGNGGTGGDAVGGNGGNGGDGAGGNAGIVAVTNEGTIQASGAGSDGILVKSEGGWGFAGAGGTPGTSTAGLAGVGGPGGAAGAGLTPGIPGSPGSPGTAGSAQDGEVGLAGDGINGIGAPITISNSGLVEAARYGIHVQAFGLEDPIAITNSGTIIGEATGILAMGPEKITIDNAGLVSSAGTAIRFLDNGVDEVSDDATISYTNRAGAIVADTGAGRGLAIDTSEAADVPGFIDFLGNDPNGKGAAIGNARLSPFLQTTLLGDVEHYGYVFGNLDICECDTITVRDGLTVLDGVINPEDEFTEGHLDLVAGGKLAMIQNPTEGASKARVEVFEHEEDGVLILELTADNQPGAYPMIEAETANLNGTLVALYEPLFGVDKITYEDVITADNLTGGYTPERTAQLYALYHTEAIEDGNTIDIEVTRTPFDAVPNLTRNQKQVGHAIEQVFGEIDPDSPFGENVAGLFTLDQAGYATFLDQLTGVEYAQYLQSVLWSMRTLNRTVTERMECDAGYFPTAARPRQGRVASNPVCHGSGRGSVWLLGQGSWNSQSGDRNAPGYVEDRYGVMGGADVGLGDNFYAGIALGYLWSGMDFDDWGGRPGATIDYQGWQAAAYGGYDQRDFYLRGIVSYGLYSADSHRDIKEPASDIAVDPSGSPDSHVYGFYGEVGERWDLGASTALAPFLGLSVSHATMEGFREADPMETGWQLTLRQSEGDSLAGLVGARLTGAWGDGMSYFRPDLMLAYEHEFGDLSNAVNASFTMAPKGAGFTARSADVPAGSLLVAAGGTLMFQRSFGLGIKYDGRFNTSYDTHAVLGTFEYHF